MLKIQANKRDISIKYVPINLVNGTLYENDGYIFIPTYLDTPSLSAGDVIFVLGTNSVHVSSMP